MLEFRPTLNCVFEERLEDFGVIDRDRAGHPFNETAIPYTGTKSDRMSRLSSLDRATMPCSRSFGVRLSDDHKRR